MGLLKLFFRRKNVFLITLRLKRHNKIGDEPYGQSGRQNENQILISCGNEATGPFWTLESFDFRMVQVFVGHVTTKHLDQQLMASFHTSC